MLSLSKHDLAPPLTAAQTQALAQLHKAATQFEGVFLNMLFSEMRKTVPTQSIFGKQSNAEQIFTGMLDEQRAQAMAQSGTLGIAKVLEAQLRQSVLANAARESKVHVPGSFQP